MLAIHRTVYSLRNHGVVPTMLKAIAVATDSCFDFRHGVDTRSWASLQDLTIHSANRDRGARYQPTHVGPLRNMLHALRGEFLPDSVFVDLGCGKGRALLLAAEFGFKQVRGVEFAHELCAVAAANCATYKRKHRLATEFRILEEDVVQHRVAGDEDVFFMFNPFDADVLNRVLDNLVTSLKLFPRRVLIIYHNARHAPVIEQRPPFAKLGTYDFGASTFGVYTNPS